MAWPTSPPRCRDSAPRRRPGPAGPDGRAAEGTAADGMGDVPPLDGAGDAPNGDGNEVITDPMTQAYLDRSPTYQRYRAFVERQQKEAARAAASASDLPADELPATDLSAGDFSESELFDATSRAGAPTAEDFVTSFEASGRRAVDVLILDFVSAFTSKRLVFRG